MSRNLVAGSAVATLGLAMFITAFDFPSVGGMEFGPGLFPKIVGAGLLLSGIGMAIEPGGGSSGVVEGTGNPLRKLLLVAVVAFFALALKPLGFHITAALALFSATLIAGGSARTAAILAIVGSFGLHFLFYSVMRVPLPWGLLLPVAW